MNVSSILLISDRNGVSYLNAESRTPLFTSFLFPGRRGCCTGLYNRVHASPNFVESPHLAGFNGS